MTIWTFIRQIKEKYDYTPWKEFEETVFTTLDGEPWHCHHASCFSPLFVISACCPYSIQMDQEINCQVHKVLQWHLHSVFPSASLEEIIGQSKDGQWQELSWAVTGISEEQALEVGRVFHQWAIFKLDGKERQVLRC